MRGKRWGVEGGGGGQKMGDRGMSKEPWGLVNSDGDWYTRRVGD